MAKKQSKEEQLQVQVIALQAEGKAYSTIADELSMPVQDAIDLTSEIIKGEVIKPEILSTKAQNSQSSMNWDSL